MELSKRENFHKRSGCDLGACSKRISPLVEDILGNAQYIKEVLPATLKYENEVYDNDWTFQQDESTAHIHQLTE